MTAAEYGTDAIIPAMPQGSVTITLFAGGGTKTNEDVPATEASLNRVTGLAAGAADGALYIAESQRRVSKVKPDGHIVTAAPDDHTLWLAACRSGTLYLSGDGDVRKFANGTFTPVGEHVIGYSRGVVVDSADRAYIADERDGIDGIVWEYVDGSPIQQLTTIRLPFALCVDNGETLYSTSEGKVVVKLTKDGPQRIAGGGTSTEDEGPALEALLDNPYALCADPMGNVYIAEEGSSYNRPRVRKVTPQGWITTLIRISDVKRIITGAQDFSPSGLAMDAQGHLYISDRANNIVLRVEDAPIDCHLELSDGRAYPAKVKPGSDLGYTWQLGNTGPSTATGVTLDVTLPQGVTLHTKYQEWEEAKRPQLVNGRTYRITVKDHDVGEGGWTPPLMVTVDSDASGALTATATANATNLDGSAPTFTATAQAGPDGVEQKSSNDWWAALLGLLGALFAFFPFGGGGGGDGGESKWRNRDKQNKATLGLSAKSNEECPTSGEKVTLTWTVTNTDTENAAMVVITNVTVPTGLTVDKVTPKQGNAQKVSNQAVLWEVASLGAEKDAVLELTATVDADPPDLVSVIGTAGAANAAITTKPLIVYPKREVGWELSDGTATRELVAKGEPVTFCWDLTNDGPSSASNGTLTVTVPTGLDTPTVKVDGTTVATTPTDNLLKGSLLTIGAKKIAKITVDGQVGKDVGKELVTQLEVSAPGANPATLRKSATARVKTVLSLSGTLVGTVVAGQRAAYRWTVDNTGGVDATDVVLKVPLPPASQAIFVEASSGGTKEADGITWKLGTVQAGRTGYTVAHCDIAATMSGKTLDTVTATLTATNAATVTAPVSAPVIERSRLQIDGGAVPREAKVGDVVTFTWTLSNEGPSEARDLTATINVPAELTEWKITPPAGASVTGTLVTIPELLPGIGNNPQVALTGTVESSDTGLVSATLDLKKGTETRGSRYVTVDVRSGARLQVTAVAATAAAVAGQTVDVAWKVHKNGKGSVGDAALIVGPCDHGTCTAAKIGTRAVPVPPGPTGLLIPLADIDTADITVTITYAIAPSSPATTTEVAAWAIWNVPDPGPRVPVTVSITRQSTLTLDRRGSSPTPVVPGLETSLLWDVSNDGPSGCAGVALRFSLPDGVTLEEVTANTRPVTPTQMTNPAGWQVALGTLAPQDSVQVAALTRLAPNLTGTTLPVTSSVNHTDTGVTINPTGNQSVPLTVQPTLTLTPSGQTMEVTGGSQAIYTWTVENTGPSTATDITLTVTVNTQDTTMTVTPDSVMGGTLNTSTSVPTVTWNGDLPPNTAHPLSIIGTTGTTAGKVTVVGQVTRGGKEEKTETVITTVQAASTKE